MERSVFRASFFHLIFALTPALFTAGVPGVVFAQKIPGVQWKGQPGVTESVATIMARARNAPPRDTNPVQPNPRKRGPDEKGDTPDANQQQNPSIFGATSPDNQPFTSALSQTVGTSFTAAKYPTDFNSFPPDSMGAVGPSQILIVINGQVRTYNKANPPTPDHAIENVTTDQFFSTVTGGASTTDPRIIYDTLTQRWFVTMITKGEHPNHVLIAVSSGSTITSTSSFTLFSFLQDFSPAGCQPPSPNVDCGLFADFPSSGVDKFAVYIGVNIFPDDTSTTYQHSTVFVVNKASLLTGSPPTPTVTAFRNVASVTAGGDGPFSPQGVSNMDPNATEGYFAGPDTIAFGNLRFLRVNDPGGTPTITALSLNVNNFQTPLAVPAQGSPQPLDGLDKRLAISQMVVKPNGDKTLWTAQTTRVNSGGSGCSISICNRNGVRFYEIGNMTTTPTVLQQPILVDSAASNWNYFWVPSVATSGQGHTILASSYAGAASFAGIAITGMLYNDTPGPFTPTPTLIPGSAAYNLQSVNPQRWGDFSNTVVDPADNMTIWTFQELTNASGNWEVDGVKLLAPPPATLTSVTPSTVSAGTTVITLIGTSSSGSGFYDPGAGFPNRLSATVSGTGVTVNSVATSDATHITLNITIAGNAPQNGRTITVTNPDGQSVTSAANFLTVGPPVQITLAPATLPAATAGLLYNQNITASGGTGPYTFSITAGTLPVGVTLISAASSGSITGTPTNSGTASFTIQAKDSLGSVGSLSYNLNVQTLLSPTVSLPFRNVPAYNPTPVTGYNAGKFTFYTTLTNNGPTIRATSHLYFKITSLIKYAGDPLQPDRLTTADNLAGNVGDIQTVNLGGVDLGTNQSVPVDFTLGIGTQNTFTIGLDLYSVASGSALTASAMTASDTVMNASGDVTALDSSVTRPDDTSITSADTAQPWATLLGHFEFLVAETPSPSGSPPSSFTAPGSFSNVGVITGPGVQSRPAVAVDPILPNRIAIASNDYLAGRVRISTSQDGGATWYSTTLSSTAGGTTFFVAQNPSLAFDSFGRLSVVYSVANLNDAANAIAISESTDLVHFNPPMALTFHLPSEQTIDSRPVIAINPNVGRVVAWDRLSQTTSRYSIMAARSAEGGLFDPPITVVGNALVSSPALALTKNTIYLGWNEWGFNSSKPYNTGGRLMIAVSLSGAHDDDRNGNGRKRNDREDDPSSNTRGLSFDTPREIARTHIGFGQRIPAMPDSEIGPDLGLATDPKDEARVYAVFADRGNGIDVRFGRSENRGKKWEFVKVNNDTGAADHFSPSIAVDAGGNVQVAFYDTRFSSTSETAHVFLARSPANGSSFDNQRVTTALLNDSKTNPLRDTTTDLADRTAIAVMNGDVLIAWTDTRNGSEDIFASSIFDPVGQSISGNGAIKFAAGSYVLNTSVAGTAEFGFDARYRRGSSVPDGAAELRFQTGKAKLTFRSTSYESLIVTGATGELRGSGTINGAGNFMFVLTVSDGEISGTGTDKFRMRITDKVTGAAIFDNVSAGQDALQPITEGRIEVRNQ